MARWSTKPPLVDYDTFTRQQLIDRLEEQLELVAKLRDCTDPRCHVCNHCVNVIFREFRPLPTHIQKKYASYPWRKG